MLSAGILATFKVGTGAAPAAMIAFGSLLFVLALMKRIPLRLEVAGAKLDASYREAYETGKEAGLEIAIDEAEEAEADGLPVAERLQELKSDELLKWVALSSRLRHFDSNTAPVAAWESSVGQQERRDERQDRVTRTDGLDSMSDPEQVRDHGRLYDIREASELAKVTLRQLDYWARTGLVPPTGQSDDGRRAFSFGDLVRMRIVKSLLDTGVSLQQIRTVVERLPWDVEVLRDLYVMSDGVDVVFAHDAKEALDVFGSRRSAFGIYVGGVVSELERDAPPR